jgi:predicted RNA polymerase sigma factor
VPLDEQDRGTWNRRHIDEGVALITGALSHAPLGPYQVQAAIAAVHDEAESTDATDWPQILALYGILEHIAPNPMVSLNRAVAIAMVHGPRDGLELLTTLESDGRMARHHRLPAVRARLLELAGEPAAAQASYRDAARRATSAPERRYLTARAARLASDDRTA